MSSNKEILKQVQKLSNSREVIDLKTLTSFLTAIPKDDNNSVGGHVFERFAKAYLKLEGFKEVYLLSEVPNKLAKRLNLDPNSDYGVDLVYKTLDGRYIGVQCKFRGNHKQTLSWSKDKLTNLTAHKGLDGYMIFTNAQGIDSQVVIQEKAMEIVKWDDLNNLDKDDFKIIRKYLQGKNTKRKGATPRPHQVPAIKDVVKGFSKYERGQLILPCRAGKTITSMVINESMGNKLTLVLVPTLGLLGQFKSEWRRFRNKEFNYFCVCSANDIDKESGEKNASIEDLGMTGLGVSTDSKEIKKMMEILNKSDDAGVVFSTYQSLPKLIQALGEDDIFDLIICDEAHRTASDSKGLFSLVHKDSNIKARKRLYMTATPKVLSNKLKQDEVASYFACMDDEKVFGPEFHRLSFAKAIELGIISDYKVVIAEVGDNQIADHIKNRKLIENGDFEMLATSAALEKLYKDYGVKNALSFHSKIDRATKFSELQKSFDDTREIYTVNSEMKITERRSRIVDFCEAENALMTNVKCLTEGITMPKLDAVVVADPINSTVMLVQAVSRALNLKKDGREAIIFIPVYTKPEEKVSESIKSSAFRNAIKTIQALSDHDERLAEVIKSIKVEDGERKPGTSGGITIGGKIELYTSYEKDEIQNNLRLRELGKLFKKRSSSSIPWTREIVEKILTNNSYKNINRWETHNRPSCRWSREQDWFEEVVEKFKLRQNNISRTREQIEKLLTEKEYKSISSWVGDDNGSYTWSKKQDWFEEVIEKFNMRKHGFKRTRKQIEKLLAEKEYKSIASWKRGSPNSLAWARKQDWYEEIVQKFDLRSKQNNRTREQIEKLLTEKKYKNIKDWQNNDKASYSWASKQHWYKKVIQKFGLRKNKSNRTREQIEKLLTEKKYKNITSWTKDNSGSYEWARKQDWYEEVVEKFKLKKPMRKYSRKSIEDQIIKKKYKNITSWEKSDSGSYAWARKQDWYEEIVQKFDLRSKQNNRTREQIEKLLLKRKYRNLKCWNESDQASYAWARKQDWYEEVVEKFKLRQNNINRTREQIEKLLTKKKYKDIVSWEKSDSGSCAWARKQDWYEEVVEKFKLRKHGLDRTREQIEKLLTENKYKNITAWEKSDSGSCAWARKQDWYEEVVEKFDLRSKQDNRTREQIEKLLTENKYKNIKEWRIHNSTSQSWASKQDWYNEVIQKFDLRSRVLNRTREQIEGYLIKENYKNLSDWKNLNLKSWNWSRKQDWYPEIKEKYFGKKDNVIKVDFKNKPKKAA